MGAVQCTNCNRWFHSKGGLSVHTCRPEGHTYFVSSFVPKFWGCVTILIQQQYNRTGQSCVHIHVCLRERVHPSAWKFITNPLSLYVCVCLCTCTCTEWPAAIALHFHWGAGLGPSDQPHPRCVGMCALGLQEGGFMRSN